MDTLVLNQGYMPINRVSWQTALGYVLSGRAEVIEEYDDWIVRSVQEIFPVPSVVRFVTKMAGFFRRGVKFNRKNVWLRDKGKCAYCGTRCALADFTFDHVVPRKQGGKTQWENIVVSCWPCNQKKEGRTPRQANMHLRVTPGRPKHLPGITMPAGAYNAGMPDSWKDYLSTVSYWHGKLDEE